MAETQGLSARAGGSGVQEDGFYEQHSPRHELPYASLGSFVFHFCLILLLPLLALPFNPPEHQDPVIGPVIKVKDPGKSHQQELPQPGPPEPTPDPGPPLPAPRPTPPVDVVEPVVVDEGRTEQADEEIRRKAEEREHEGKRIAAAAGKALDEYQERLNKGGGVDAPKRGDRVARWVLHFDTRGARNYLEQFGALGAEVAFPQRGDQWLFYNLSHEPWEQQTRSLDSDNRLYWQDDDPESVHAVCAELDIAATDFMVAFLPTELEEELLAMELSYGSPKTEQEIERTDFKVVPRGGGYGVIVENQVLKPKNE